MPGWDRILLILGAALALVVPWPALAAESVHPASQVIAEIRSLLAEGLPNPPSTEALEALDQGDFASRLQVIDPYAEWFPVGAFRPGRDRSGWWSGIGADISFDGDDVRLLPYQGGPAAAAGVPDRARLLAIDGQAIRPLSPEALAERLRGPSGSWIQLTISDESGEAMTVSLRRQWVRPLDVELIGTDGRRVIRLREFLAGLSRSALLATVSFLRDQPGMKNEQPLIIDLRYNPGGDLFEAFDLAGLFVPAGTVLGSLHSRSQHPREVLAPAGDKLEGKIILLVGPDTASAAEVFAGALQQLGRARLVGQPTFGKCSSQTEVPLSDGSVFRYTNLEILLPGGIGCDGLGVAPDLVMPTAQLVDLLDKVITK